MKSGRACTPECLPLPERLSAARGFGKRGFAQAGVTAKAGVAFSSLCHCEERSDVAISVYLINWGLYT
jgi:hypothetical protein